MKNWLKVACVLAGAGLSVVLQAQQAGGSRPGVVVDINPGRIILMDVVRAGGRLVTVGERGFALLSDDDGQTWRSVATPVHRTLTRVAFEGDRLGVAVGHGGSVVRTEDGGETWTEVAVEEAVPDSLLGVTSLGGGRFAAYGAFGLYFLSADGGRTWQRHTVISEEFENHISQVIAVGDALWLVAEYGTLARSDDGGVTWTELASPYQGSLFGIVAAQDGSLVVFGMRGNVFRSADGGASWQRIETGTTTAFNGGTVLADGQIVLVGNAGMVARSTDHGTTLKVEWTPEGRGFAAVAEVPGGVVVAGESGVRQLDPARLASN
jgi:photosystem II stability/assembly factor-like uncharacterized protein